MGMSRSKSFMYGQGSALVEPVAAVLGAFSDLFNLILPYALALPQVP
jgi:ZIP family zinc transporter